MSLEDLKNKILCYDPSADTQLIDRVYAFAADKHRDHKRFSGDPYITHPLAVAEILAGLEQDVPTICAALLHDTIEDAGVTANDIATKFSLEIAKLVEGVTKLGQLVYESREIRQAESFRKMFVAMGEDLRVIVIKLADRLHNMRTLKYLSPEKQIETSQETRDIFAPLAHRLGMWKLKWELEDLAFAYLEPESYNLLRKKVGESREEREKYIEKFIEKVQETLAKFEIKAEIYGRPKHFYSIYRKMVDQNLEFEEIFDLTAVRVIVDTLKDCYSVLGIIHAAWKPLPDRFRDYIAVPKSNGYQSLHTTVMGEGARPVEVQIRTKEMHRIAEYGVAAHWVYKEEDTDKKFDKKMAWFRQMLETQTELKDARDFMDSLKIDLFVDEVFVFTPKGQVIQLPLGATPIDFAYHVHTEVGHRCTGAKVNGRIVPLDYPLKNGEIVEILTGKSDNTTLDWLNIVKTSGARAKIKSWFRKRKRDESIIRGREALEEEVKKLRLHPKEVLTVECIDWLVKESKAKSHDDLYADIGYGEISAFDSARKVRDRIPGAPKVEKEEAQPFVQAKPRKRKIIHGLRIAGMDGILTRISKCCKPLPGDDIIGVVTRGRGVAIHKTDCGTLQRSDPGKERLVKVEWDLTADIFYPVEIEVEAFDRVGVLKDILEKISETKTNVSSADIKTKRGSTMFLKLVIDIKNIEHLQQVCAAIRKVADVYDVSRATR
ncbi:MAG TPA: bifunctional (p)ppGpp synthetase/guanosine-3',5'-bis(diphosphate) 3'-pyrophosphohydrolase [Candidatus Omnitrophota bacterium]|nr:bifunctional (p)ppGpp synthetase/guanosine-3',5'-bis(diphosphate) 3'-pyrophosphohydrolase [Candidatus Omnitrophota bacterium]